MSSIPAGGKLRTSCLFILQACKELELWIAMLPIQLMVRMGLNPSLNPELPRYKSWTRFFRITATYSYNGKFQVKLIMLKAAIVLEAFQNKKKDLFPNLPQSKLKLLYSIVINSTFIVGSFQRLITQDVKTFLYNNTPAVADIIFQRLGYIVLGCLS